jgi:hypothetical protein
VPASPASNTRSKKKVGFEWKPLVFGCYFGDLVVKTTAALLSLYFCMTVMWDECLWVGMTMRWNSVG